MKQPFTLLLSANTSLLDAINSKDPVSGYTHSFYRYPARFSPLFVREIIRQYSTSKDAILDPFMGGGTAIVEALAMGRRAVGLDINALAHFVATTKTTPLSKNDSTLIRNWADDLRARLRYGARILGERVHNFPWQVQRFTSEVMARADELPAGRQRRFVRSALLRTGQWAVDCTSRIPPKREMLREFVETLIRMLEGVEEFAVACERHGFQKNQIQRKRLLLCRSAAGLENDARLRLWPKPQLVVTSPPYPSVHILYHRWQVGGRRETAAPYWIAAVNDGQPASHYTFGSRSALGLENYFRSVEECFRSVRQVIGSKATVVQMLAFSDAASQLPRYLVAMERAGYREFKGISFDARDRVWRQVPNRKWYCHRRKEQDSAREVVLFHHPA